MLAAVMLIACAPLTVTAHDVDAIVSVAPIPAAVTADTPVIIASTFEQLGGAVDDWLFGAVAYLTPVPMNDGVPGDELAPVTVAWQPYDVTFTHVQASISAARLLHEPGWQMSNQR